MKKAILLGLVFCFVAASAFAQKTVITMTIKGTIIDNQCAGSQKPEALATFIKTHPKQCALKCASSGYSIFSNGKLMKFDKESSAKIEAFLKKPESKLEVVVVVKKVDNNLSLVSIGNQK